MSDIYSVFRQFVIFCCAACHGMLTISFVFYSTPQINSWKSNWIEFYAEHRLGYQLKLAREQYGDSTIYEKGN